MHDIAVLITDTQENNNKKAASFSVVAVRLASTLLKKDEHVHSS
jgi:hypothetical protein